MRLNCSIRDHGFAERVLGKQRAKQSAPAAGRTLNGNAGCGHRGSYWALETVIAKRFEFGVPDDFVKAWEAFRQR